MIEITIPEKVTHGKPKAIVDLFKILVSSLLGGSTKFIVLARHDKVDNLLKLNCYCDPKEVGALLGRESGFIAPTKQAMIRILSVVAYKSGVNRVEINIDDFRKMPEPEGEDND
ncbi:hypothetical protein KAU11_07200 [Candidatus Babeliales bacterium]|nr:hypothetical protein [Candidatus Babeliales bacterium]